MRKTALLAASLFILLAGAFYLFGQVHGVGGTGGAGGTGSGSGSGTIGKGTITLSGTIASGASATSSVAMAGVTTTSVCLASFNGAFIGITGFVPSTGGMLAIGSYPTAGNCNFTVINNTGASITMGSTTLNVVAF